jgi:hypothetical protein
MMILSARNAFQYIPIRDYKYFIDEVYAIGNGHHLIDEIAESGAKINQPSDDGPTDIHGKPSV